MVALHAHPDDEALLTGGTLAGLARGGHRVVLVVATDGERGLTASAGTELGSLRRAESDRAAAVLGVARVVRLGYADSGDSGAEPGGFCHTPVGTVAERVARIVREEDADLLIGYDRLGGYGHPDHLHVHAVAEAVAASTGVRLLQATVDRAALGRALRVLARCRLLPGDVTPDEATGWYSDRAEITHRIGVRRVARAKREALACHASQSTGGTAVRTVRLLTRLPRPVFAFVAGTEWFVEPGAVVGAAPLRDVLEPARRAAA